MLEDGGEGTVVEWGGLPGKKKKKGSRGEKYPMPRRTFLSSSIFNHISHESSLSLAQSSPHRLCFYPVFAHDAEQQFHGVLVCVYHPTLNCQWPSGKSHNSEWLVVGEMLTKQRRCLISSVVFSGGQVTTVPASRYWKVEGEVSRVSAQRVFQIKPVFNASCREQLSNACAWPQPSVLLLSFLSP